MNPELKRAIFEWLVTFAPLRAAGGWPPSTPVPLHWMNAPRDPPMPYMVYRLKETGSQAEDGSSIVHLMIDVWDGGENVNKSTRCDRIAYVVKQRMAKFQQFCDSEGNPLVMRAKFLDGGPVPTESEKVWRYENTWNIFFMDTPDTEG